MRTIHACGAQALRRGCLVATVALAGPANAQDVTPQSHSAFPRGELAIGAVITPALEGAGPWFMPAIRLSAPLGSTLAIDLDAGRIYGGINKYAEIERFYAAQIRFVREPLRSDTTRGYWLVGPLYLPITKLDGKGNFVRRKASTFLTVGRGWDQLFQNGSRFTGELGFSGGEGFIFYARAGLQWRPFHRGPALRASVGAARVARRRAALTSSAR